MLQLLSTYADRQGVYILFTVCVFVRIQISSTRIKLVVSLTFVVSLTPLETYHLQVFLDDVMY